MMAFSCSVLCSASRTRVLDSGSSARISPIEKSVAKETRKKKIKKKKKGKKEKRGTHQFPFI
jgi:hypothetical protein